MLLKLKKSQSKIDFNDQEMFPSELEVLEIISKHPLDITGDLARFKNLRVFTLMTPKLASFEISFETSNNLKTLKFKDTKLPTECLIRNNSIETLQLSGSGLYQVPIWLCELTSLKMLDISSNSLNELPNEFSWLKNLKRLNIDSNEFSEIPRVLLDMNSLEHLSHDNNKISEEQRQEFIKQKNS